MGSGHYYYEPLLDAFNSYVLEKEQYLKEVKEKQPEIDLPYDDLDNSIIDAFEKWNEEREWQLLTLFDNTIEEFEKDRTYYFGCTFSLYSELYEQRKQSFLKEYEDSTEIDFINEELLKGIHTPPYDSKLIFRKTYKRIVYSLNKRFEFLGIKALELGYSITYFEPTNMFNRDSKESFELSPIANKAPTKPVGIKWQGTQTELIELIKSLRESGKISGTQKEIIEIFSSFFNIEIKNPDKLLQDIKNRNNGSETLFLDTLKKTLLDYIQN